MARPTPWAGKAEDHGSTHDTHDPLLRGEDSWLAHSNNMTKNSGNSDTRDSSGRSRHNKNKRRINGDNAEDTAVNAGSRGSKSGQRKKPFKRTAPGPSNLDQILDRLCQIHGTPEKPANHTKGTVGYSSRQAS